VLLGALLLVAEPAPAAFTGEEQESLLNLRSAWMELQSVMSGYISFTTSKYVTAANHQAIGAATGMTVQAIVELNDAIAVLFGVIPDLPGGPLRVTWTGMTRAERVAWAVERLDRALVRIGVSQVQWAQVAEAHLVDNAEFQDWIRRVVMSLGSADSAMRRFNRGLAYANYYPELPTPNGSRTVVGPHGDYDEAQWHLWRSAAYFTLAMGSLATALTTGSPTDDYAQMGRPYTQLAQANGNAIEAMYIFGAALPSSKSRFFHVLDGIKPLTIRDYPGTPMLLHSLNIEWRSAFWPKFGRNAEWDRSVTDAVLVAADGWKLSDHAVWMLMVFPDCSILRNPEGCGGRVTP
jgi:hypothetical protein